MSASDTKKKQVPALKGWFAMPPEKPQLIGSRCKSCGHIAFPMAGFCRNPDCPKTEPLEEVKLSPKGKLFSFTINYYAPPMPYRAPKPYVPFGIAVVQLPEGLQVPGQVSSEVDPMSLKVGMDMELVIERLYDDDQGNEIVAWKFKPVKK